MLLDLFVVGTRVLRLADRLDRIEAFGIKVVALDVVTERRECRRRRLGQGVTEAGGRRMGNDREGEHGLV